jgi:hypothetical protein
MGRLWLITCDRCGAESRPHPLKVEVVRECERNGWHLKRIPGACDICPDCYGRATARRHQGGDAGP